MQVTIFPDMDDKNEVSDFPGQMDNSAHCLPKRNQLQRHAQLRLYTMSSLRPRLASKASNQAPFNNANKHKSTLKIRNRAGRKISSYLYTNNCYKHVYTILCRLVFTSSSQTIFLQYLKKNSEANASKFFKKYWNFLKKILKKSNSSLLLNM